MRLINVTTLDLEEFYGDQIPQYAILSHTWEVGEVTFQDWSDRAAASRKAGFNKIQRACRQARLDSVEYLWVDTNCIDKSSSAELTEAINSMFAWYRDAKCCYAYLSDVSAAQPGDAHPLARFRASRWFTRGWTLQELLAPQDVVFYSRDWLEIGTKSSDSLKHEIAGITGIDAAFLHTRPLELASVAQKMSWLAKRVTTRIEDIAYCALGIFDINMPLLYGEGTKAFIRLQEEIIKVSNDHTIFCWAWLDSTPTHWVSMLAPSPAEFQFSGSYIEEKIIMEPSTYSMTNAGLSIRLPVLHTWSHVMAILNVTFENNSSTTQAAIPIATHKMGTFRRISFPPKPAFVMATISLKAQNLLVSAKPDLSVQSLHSLSTPKLAHGVMLVFGNVFQGITSDGYGSSELGEGIAASERMENFYTGTETYPPNMLDRDRNLYMIPTFQTGRQSLGALMIRLGLRSATKANISLSYVLCFGLRIRESGEATWCCELRRPDIWCSCVDLETQCQCRQKCHAELVSHVGNLESNWVTHTLFANSATRAPAGHISLPNVTLKVGADMDIGPQQLVCVAHLFGKEAVTSEADSNCADFGENMSLDGNADLQDLEPWSPYPEP